MEREGNKGPDPNNGSNTADVGTNKKPTTHGEQGVAQEAYEQAKDDAVKDLHG